jgi:uroporphyrinogen decarboxylase
MAEVESLMPAMRLRAAIDGRRVDHPPVSLWRHFPEVDQTAEGLAGATLSWQRRFGFDFVKFMPPGDYPIIDWGGVTIYEGATGGTRTTKRFPIAAAADWRRLRPVDVGQGFNRVVLDAVVLTREGLAADVPLLHTVFSPLTIAMKLSNGQAVAQLAANGDDLHEALKVIAEVTRAHIGASLAAGADGFFFATQCADGAVTSIDAYREFGLQYDLAVLEAVGSGPIVLLHLHGAKPMFELQGDYPADILNWHDRRASPSLAEGRRLSGRCVTGGIDERRIAVRSAEEIGAEVAGAIEAIGGPGLVVAPGCVIPIDTPEANVDAAVAAARAAAEHQGRDV